jgi:tetratricopeptide (TPR) repeat protein
MNFWHILEIDPTDNATIIKKAYAKKLKLHHPEDDPEGYQRLREAYDAALKYIKNNKDKPPIISKKEKKEIPEIILKQDNIENIKYTPPIRILEELTEKAPSFEEAVEEFINNAQILYDDFFSRINIEKWRTLLNSEVMWYMGDKKLLSDEMIGFLIENHYLPQDVWKLFEDNFHWKDQKEYLYSEYPKKFIDYIFKQINDKNGLRYCYFKEALDLDYETFLEYREKALDALCDNYFDYAEEYINIASKIYAEDPDLLILRARCYVKKGDVDKALQIFEGLLQRHSEDVYARFYRAKVLYDKGEIHSAFDECKYIEAHHFEAQRFDNFDFVLLLAKCYFEFEEFEKSKALLLQLSDAEYLKNEVKELLRKINSDLVHKLRDKQRKSKKNKEIKAELDKLYRELGILDSKKIREKFAHIMLKRITICMLILLVQVIIIHSTMKTIDSNASTSFKSTAQFIMSMGKINLVKDSEDIIKLPAQISKVQGKLTEAEFTGLCRIPTKDEHGELHRLYLTHKEAEEKGVYEDMDGYVCIGTLGDKKVIAVVNYEQADQAYKTRTIDFDGTIFYMPMDDLVNEVKKQYKTKQFDQEFITDIFIDTKVKVPNNREAVLSIDALLLFIQFIVIINGLVSGYRLIKVNRNKIGI